MSAEVSVNEEPEFNALAVPWRAQPDDLIGGWCCTFPAGDSRTPATGAIQVADFCREEDAKHVATLHNLWLANRLYSPR